MTPSPLPPKKSPIGWILAGSLFLSHGLVTFLALWLSDHNEAICLILGIVGLASLLAYFPLLRTLGQVQDALVDLSHGRKPQGLSQKGHGLLAGLVAQVRAVAEWQHAAGSERDAWLQQAEQAAAQSERSRLARDLHDSIKQQLFSIQMSAAALKRNLDDPSARSEAVLSDLQEATQAALSEMNALLQQLAPAPLERVGLVEALRAQCEALGYRAGIEVSTEFGSMPSMDSLPPDAAEDLFRIGQEALSNIARHARAHSARLYLGRRAPTGPLLLEISDDGQGFDPDAASNGQGLTNLRERAAALGSVFQLRSAPGKGTTLSIFLPVRALEPEETLKIDPTYNKLYLTGILGSLVLIFLMMQPLSTWLSQRNLPVMGLPDSVPLSFVLLILAALAAMLTGFVASWWTNTSSRGTNLLNGALSGGVAGTVLFFGLTSSVTAIVMYGKAGLLHSQTPDDAQFRALLIEGIPWMYLAFWACLLGGAGLGSVGGLLAPLRQGRQGTLYPGWLIMQLAVLCGGVSFRLSQAYLDLEQIDPLWQGISLWPAATTLILYLVPLASVYVLLRRDLAFPDPQRLGTVSQRAFFCACLAFLVAMSQQWNIPVSGLFATGAVAGLLASVLFCWLGIRAKTQAAAVGLLPAPDRYFGLLSMLAALLGASMLGVSPDGKLIIFFFILIGMQSWLRSRAKLPLRSWFWVDERTLAETSSTFWGAVLQGLLPFLITVTIAFVLGIPGEFNYRAGNLIMEHVWQRLSNIGLLVLFGTLALSGVLYGLTLLALTLLKRYNPAKGVRS